MILPPRVKWSKIITNQSPPARCYGACDVYGNLLYISGGADVDDDLWCYNFDTNTFQQLESLSKENPQRRYSHSIIVVEDGKAIYLFGGCYQGKYFNDLWKYNIQNKTWKQIYQGNYRPSPRSNFAMFIHDNKLYVCGGVFWDGTMCKFNNNNITTQNKKYTILNDIHIFDFNTQIWKNCGSKLVNTAFFAWTKYKNNLYIHGGCTFSGHDGSENYNITFCRLNLDDFQQSNIDCVVNSPSSRYGHSIHISDNRLYLFGGENNDGLCSDGIYCYDFDINFWIRPGTKEENCRIFPSFSLTQVYKDDIYIIGGCTVTKSRSTLSTSYGNFINVSRLSKPVDDFYKLQITPVFDQATRVTNDLRSLINNPDYADVCFVIKEKKVYAHKNILSVRSEYFKYMLATDIDLLTNAIKIDDGTSYITFLQVMEFLYSGRIENMNLENAMDLLAAAEKYALPDLILLCARTTDSVEITTKTAVNILLASHRQKIDELKENAMKFIFKNWNDQNIKYDINKIDDIELLRELLMRKE